MHKAAKINQDEQPGSSRRLKDARLCYFEKLLANHIQERLQEERSRYDQALVRANEMLQQTHQLKQQLRNLADDFYHLEDHFEHLNDLNRGFKREAKIRMDYLDNQVYLAEIIARLLNQDQGKELLVPLQLVRSPLDMMLRPRPDEAKHRRKRRKFLSKFLCSHGVERE